MKPGFPSRVDRRVAQQEVGQDDIRWLVANNILSTRFSDAYGLVVEFLRIRLRRDSIARSDEQALYEVAVIRRQYTAADDED
jgi:hypothetical protein